MTSLLLLYFSHFYSTSIAKIVTQLFFELVFTVAAIVINPNISCK